LIEVVSIAGIATVQDGGRPGRMHEGIPPGGPLVPEGLARANAAARNAPSEAAVELVGTMTLRALGPLQVASDAGDRLDLDAMAEWTVACRAARVRYIAVRGGIDVPCILGGRGTLLAASWGGHEGRPLRKGDVLRVGSAATIVGPMPPGPDDRAAIRVMGGPDAERFDSTALDVLLGSTFRISARGDRTGIRLVGPTLGRSDGDAGASAPMVKGAIQVPASGEAIVLGPDHPTVGGYPVLATVVRADVGNLMARVPGADVRFVLMSRPHGQAPQR
jgi:allophanate hydrolase subunit 2